ncbi:MAG: hypothetical protein PVH88_00215 [Ignavibacteria bacterium]
MDFALLENKDSWLRHSVLGDPSFDDFERNENNPLERGSTPFEWPVNGYYFKDPVSSDEYIYVSEYYYGYAMPPGKSIIIDKTIVVYCSSDEGNSWERLGPIYNYDEVVLEGEEKPIMSSRDAAIVYDDGKYYMVTGFGTTEYDWHPVKRKHGGLLLSVADAPEGPFTLKKIVLSNQLFNEDPLFGKYNRCYAGTLLKVKDQWVILYMMDSEGYYSWGLFAISAPSPEGPWSEPVLIRGCEGDYYYPPLLEYFPAFQHNDNIYAPSTSVAANRNFQCMLKVSSEDVMNPDKWEMMYEGSLWHSLNVENEYAGIWGQTFSGVIDDKGKFKVMFPSRDPNNLGTINLASVSWDKIHKEKGFVLTGHEGPSFTTIPNFYQHPEVHAEFSYYGTVSFAMNYLAPVGPNYPMAGSVLHELMFTSHNRLELNESQWMLLSVNHTGKTNTISKGNFAKGDKTDLKITTENQETFIYLDKKLVWNGKLKNTDWGRLGLFAMERSGIEMEFFVVNGENRKGYSSWLYTEGLLGSGSNMKKDWELREDDTLFRYKCGVVSKINTGWGKWNFKGQGFELYSPSLPELGIAELILNGEKIGEINLHSDKPEKSKIVYSMFSLPQDKNALVIKAKNGRIALDCLRVYE